MSLFYLNCFVFHYYSLVASIRPLVDGHHDRPVLQQEGESLFSIIPNEPPIDFVRRSGTSF